jgi:hypothetical protein
MVEGDADLKATDVDGKFLQVELSSHFNFVAFATVNPFKNGVYDAESMSTNQMIRIEPWRDGDSLKLKKYLSIRFIDDEKPPQIVPVVDEIRVIDGVYPPLMLIRETVYTDEPFYLYLLCR